MEVEIIVFVISTQWRAFSTVLLDLSAEITDSFEGTGLIGGGLTGGFSVKQNFKARNFKLLILTSEFMPEYVCSSCR